MINDLPLPEQLNDLPLLQLLNDLSLLKLLNELPLLEQINEQNQSALFSKKRFIQIKKVLNSVLENINNLIEPFITLKMKKSINEKEVKELNLGYKIQLINLKKIIVQSFGIEMAFVTPISSLKNPYQFGTFKIFHYFISLLTEFYQFQDGKLNELIIDFQKQNKYLLEYSKHLGLNFFENQNQENIKQFINNLKDLFQNDTYQILKEILQILCAILKLINIGIQNNCENKNQKEDQQLDECQKGSSQNKSEYDQQSVESQKGQQSNKSKDDQSSVQGQKGSEQDEQSDVKYSQPFTYIPDEDEEDDRIDNLEIDPQSDQIHILDTKNQEKSEKEQLIEVFQNQLDVQIDGQNQPLIEKLLDNYSGKASNLLLNSNRIIGYAQHLYQKLIQSFFIQVGLSLSKKIRYDQEINKEYQATFLRFPDQILGGSKARPYQTNCYFINLCRDLINCWYQIQKYPIEKNEQVEKTKEEIEKNEQIEKMKEQFKVLENNTIELQKLNDQKSIKKFFNDVKVNDFNLLVQISHKSQNDQKPWTTYDFNDFCKVNHYDISEDDKQILKTSKLNLFNVKHNQNDNEKLLKQKNSTVIRELFQKFQSIQNYNNVYNYEIVNNSLIKVLDDYIQNIKNQEVQDRRNQNQNNGLYQYQNFEGSSSDGSSSSGSKSQNVLD